MGFCIWCLNPSVYKGKRERERGDREEGRLNEQDQIVIKGHVRTRHAAEEKKKEEGEELQRRFSLEPPPSTQLSCTL